MSVTYLEPWLDLRGIATYFASSPRWIEERMREGLPSAMIAGKRKFKASEVEKWLDAEGHIRRESA